MAGDEEPNAGGPPSTGNSEMDEMVEGVTRVDENTVRYDMTGGVSMTVTDEDGGQQRTVHADLPFRPDMSMTGTNLTTDRPDAAPVPLREAPPTQDSSWNLESLEQTRDWLNRHADYLERQRVGMMQLKDLIDGPPSNQAPAVGSFQGAMMIHQKHTMLHDSFSGGLKGIVEQLRDAADALDKIAKNYAAAEERNALTVAQWSKILGEGADSTHPTKVPDNAA